MQLTTDEKLEQRNESGAAAAKKAGGGLRTPEELGEIVSLFASSDGWMEKVRLRTDERWYERLYHGPDHDIWAISWLPGQSTGYHDHGESSGALIVATGVLEEHRPAERPLVIYPGQPQTFGPDYAHDVRNVSLAPAISIHAYSPPLSDMNEYELDEGRLVPRDRESGRAKAAGQQSRERAEGVSIEEVLSAARAKLRRLTPEEVLEEIDKEKAILVDIRPEGQRAVEGGIAGAIIVERNVLEWRFDPKSSARLPLATDHDIRVIVFCSEGYTSSLAAVALKDLGLWRVTDMIGGFRAWKDRGLPIIAGKQGER